MQESVLGKGKVGGEGGKALPSLRDHSDRGVGKGLALALSLGSAITSLGAFCPRGAVFSSIKWRQPPPPPPPTRLLCAGLASIYQQALRSVIPGPSAEGTRAALELGGHSPALPEPPQASSILSLGPPRVR